MGRDRTKDVSWAGHSQLTQECTVAIDTSIGSGPTAFHPELGRGQEAPTSS